MKKRILVISLTVAVPLLLWLDVWLAFQFGFWIDRIAPHNFGTGGLLGMFAFGALALVQGLVIGTELDRG